jgi:dienelactone hydrolase
MSISFSCPGCGKSFQVRDELAGRTGRCDQCGSEMPIPGKPSGIAAEVQPTLAPSKMKSSGMSGRGIGLLVFVVLIGVRVYLRSQNNANRNNANAPAMQPQVTLDPVAAQRQAVRQLAGDGTGPISLPRFPDASPPREIEPGVTFREVVLGTGIAPVGAPPGRTGKLWLYTPTGDHAEHSLPCVLIAPAGTNLLTGNTLGEMGKSSDQPEHIPYVKAGFAVLAYELDGPAPQGPDPSDDETGTAMIKFLAARAGLVNAHIALEYVLAKVPEVDPKRISAAGHSSAGTLAVLFAEREPRLASCVAFAPALDIAKRFGPEAVAELKKVGLGDLTDRYSPITDIARISRPIFLFHARDDSNLPVADTEAFAAKLKSLNKPVTLDLVDTGDHYQSMINEGIPHAIAWLKANEQIKP